MTAELSRRDALAALAVIGSAAGASTAYLAERGRVDRRSPAGTDDADPAVESLDEHSMETLIAIAAVVYPSPVSGIGPFVEEFVSGRVARHPDLAAGITASVDRLDGLARDWFDAPVGELSPETRDRLLREAGVDTAEAAPEGSPAERMRYYLVNELLYGLYASPTGGALVGLENPQGHPGGLESYQRGP